MFKKIIGGCARLVLYPLLDILVRMTTKPGIEGDPKDILIVRTDHIGDFILFTPALALIKKHFPDSRLVFIGNSALEDIAFRFPVGEFIPFDLVRLRWNIWYRLKLLRMLRRRNFKAVLNPLFFKTPHGDSLVRLVNAKEKIGIVGDDAGIYTKMISIDSKIESELDRNRAFLEGLGITVGDFLPKILPTEEDRKRAMEILENHRLSSKDSFVVVAPGAGWPGRRWPAEKFSEVIQWLKEEGITPILIGAPGSEDRALGNRVTAEAGVPVVDLIGRLSLPVLAAILEASRCYIGNDSGAVHIAAAVGTPAVCIMGGGNFRRFFPYGDLEKNRIVYLEEAIASGCRGCNWTCSCCLVPGGVPRCIRDVTVPQVVQEIRVLLPLTGGLREPRIPI